jgi:hypothetical protein
VILFFMHELTQQPHEADCGTAFFFLVILFG